MSTLTFITTIFKHINFSCFFLNNYGLFVVKWPTRQQKNKNLYLFYGKGLLEIK